MEWVRGRRKAVQACPKVRRARVLHLKPCSGPSKRAVLAILRRTAQLVDCAAMD